MTDASVLIICNHEPCREQAERLAGKLGVAVEFNVDVQSLAAPEFALLFAEQGVVLQQTGRKVPGPVAAEFVEGSVDHRRKFGGGKGQMIAKAVGVRANVYPLVLDATAGLGKDAFVLATLGCKVQMLERSPYVHALLDNGLQRARQVYDDVELQQIVARMELLEVDSQEYLSQDSNSLAQRPDVVYLDPMFPERQKSADVKKEMVAFHHIVGGDEDADRLLDKALAIALYRVVVKRPRKAPFLAGKSPSYQLEGKSSRFDIYTLKKMPDILHPA
ncbi:MAG TPA: class I SAM-dependent methyltransferase [Cellvibrio sp.]|nr:class I SAM-dependent methyltransferase [Cellvibrio sp.]